MSPLVYTLFFNLASGPNFGEYYINAGFDKSVKPSTDSYDVILQVGYTVIIECQDNRFRAELRHIKLNRAGNPTRPVEYFEIFNEKKTRVAIEEIHSELRKVIPSLTKAIIEYKTF